LAFGAVTLKKLETGIEGTLAYMAFPSKNWPKIQTTNTIERLNHEIKRWAKVVSTFPDGNSALMLFCARFRYVTGTKRGSKHYKLISEKYWAVPPIAFRT
jgi:putative transposase